MAVIDGLRGSPSPSPSPSLCTLRTKLVPPLYWLPVDKGVVAARRKRLQANKEAKKVKEAAEQSQIEEEAERMAATENEVVDLLGGQ